MNQPPPYGPPPGYPPQGYYPPPQPPPSKGTSPLVIILAIFGGIFVLGVGSCVVCVGAGAHAVKQAEEDKKAKDESAKKDSTKVDLATLLADYKANEIKGDKKYKGKAVQITGIVGEIKKDIVDDPYVTIGTTKDDFELPRVDCHFASDNKSDLADLSPGDKVTVVGVVDGLSIDVQLNDCDVK